MQFDPNHLAALAAVLRLGSFEGAAAELGVTPSAISQRIKALEERVGTPLIHRGQPCTGTDVGLRLAKHAEDVALLEQHLSKDLGLGQSCRPARLRIAVNADSLATWFVGALADAGDVLFDLVVDDQDHSGDWLKRGEVSAAITADPRAVTGCDIFALGSLPYLATASPAYMKRWFAQGVTPETAARAPCIIFNAKDQLQRRWLDTHVAQRLTPPSHFLPSTQAFIAAAEAGLGWGMNPERLVRPLIETGRLVELIPGTGQATPLYWQVSRIMAPALRSVTRSVRRAAKVGLIQPT